MQVAARWAPMKAVTGPVPTEPGWTAEVKWDGMRALVHVRAAQVHVRNARGADVTVAWPELAAMTDATGGLDAVVDGEVVALDESGRPGFERLQQRMHVRDAREAQRRAALVPVRLMAFDLLHLDGHDLFELGLEQRRAILGDLVAEDAACAVPPAYDDPTALLEAVRARGLEGIVAKRSGSPYRPGRRSADWRKVKVRARQELVVGGVTAGTGARAGSPGALLVGHHDGAGGPLRYAGRVGSGLSGRTEALVSALLSGLDRPDAPFDPPPGHREVRGPVRWVQPRVVVEVAFAEWTAEGRLRQPSLVGIRSDKDAAEVVREPGDHPGG